ncbi:D-3-phosphoglycerate dehydrogenase [Bradyrhizobium macuxiense]|uniref:D-3-phosphoglycerate dehydrogenase n=1 Tax=Bradyrhizobium macuxiense TaxID=1755647 RepID=A0A560L080_9BRAD|nr:C-terminal binding protein [Bradyrhizobium macuxiense]TWB87794.1 D-3-phosphoglycerate dehydrogenase [Bradyrhizobium macuxiense]
MKTVLMTDRAWPDTELEEAILTAAGHRLVAGADTPAKAEDVERLVRDLEPSAVLTCWSRVSSAAIQSSPRLEIVARLGVGLDNIDVAAATQTGVWVTNVPDYCVEEVSDHAIGMLLAWTRGIVGLATDVRAGHWDPGKARLRRLSALTVGILGFGRIGRRTASKLEGWGVRLLAYDPSANIEPPVESCSLAELVRLSDAIIVHAPLNAVTRHLFNADTLASMRPDSMLINVSRGAIVSSAALVAALQAGQIGGAGLDVLEDEPAVPLELRELPNVTMTPHVAFSSDVSLIELRTRACEEVVRVLRGEKPLHACNRPNADKP